MVPSFSADSFSPHQEVINDESFTSFTLNMLSRLVVAEEHFSKRRSCMRTFVRMDISVYQRDGMFHYMINELTRSHQTVLFMHWGGVAMVACLEEVSRVLYYVTYMESMDRAVAR